MTAKLKSLALDWR